MKTAMDFKRIENKQLNYKVQQLEYRVKELQQALYESEAEALQRDYDEFKAPDLDNDDVISKAEFSSYIKNYMKAYPQIPEDEYPTFEEFDIDGNGVVTFEEWQRYLQLQNKKESSSSSRQGAAAASRKSNAGRGGGANSAGGAAGGYGADDSFQSLYEKLRSI